MIYRRVLFFIGLILSLGTTLSSFASADDEGNSLSYTLGQAHWVRPSLKPVTFEDARILCEEIEEDLPSHDSCRLPSYLEWYDLRSYYEPLRNQLGLQKSDYAWTLTYGTQLVGHDRLGRGSENYTSRYFSVVSAGFFPDNFRVAVGRVLTAPPIRNPESKLSVVCLCK